jgi:hypothetical protein
MATVLIPLAEGFEEIEAVTLIDVLRRAEIDVVTASLTEDLNITASRGVRLVADATLDAVIDDEFDMMVLPINGFMRCSNGLTRLINGLEQYVQHPWFWHMLAC